MGTLWTPGGEREVPPAGPDPQSEAETGTPSAGPAEDAGQPDHLRAAAEAIGVDLDSLNEEERAQLAAELDEMMAVRRQVGATPAAEMLANHMMRLFDLATIYLETDPPSFNDAFTVIEAFRSMVDGLEGKLGEHEGMLTDALKQLQSLFVQAKGATEAAPPG